MLRSHSQKQQLKKSNTENKIKNDEMQFCILVKAQLVIILIKRMCVVHLMWPHAHINEHNDGQECIVRTRLYPHLIIIRREKKCIALSS